MNRIILSILVLCLIGIIPASAVQTSVQEDVTSFDIDALDGYLISSIDLDNIPGNFNSTVNLDAYGENYYLQINGTKSWGWWTYDLSLVYPDGSVDTIQKKTLKPYSTDTDIKIQYFYGQADFIDVDLYVGILPLTASFQNNLYSVDSSLNENLTGDILSAFGAQYYTRLAYSSVTGSCTQPFDLKVYYSTTEEFEKQQAESIGEYLSGTTELFFSWAWDNIINFIEMIPGIGPHLADSLEFAALLIDTIFFYFRLFFIDYIEVTILSTEFLILSRALIKTRNNSNIFVLLDKIVSSHVDAFEFVIDTMSKVINLFTSIVRMIALIVQAIKPI